MQSSSRRSWTSTVTRSVLTLLVVVTISAPVRAAVTPVPTTVHVRIANLAFVPKIIHVSVGTTIVWTNEDDVVHTVTSGTTHDDGRWKGAPSIGPGKSFSARFATPGTFPYYCQVHFYDESMHSMIVVGK